MDEKQYAVLLTETQDVKVIACNPDKDIFDIGREAIGCDWIELVEAEPLEKDGLLMLIDEEGKLKPGGALINATASALYGTEQHGDPIMGNAVIVRTTGENLELLTSGEAEQLAVRMEAVRDGALQKIAEAFARRPKLPTLSELSEEYDLLLSQKKQAGEQLSHLNDELKNLRHIKLNMDTLLDDERFEEGQTQRMRDAEPEHEQHTTGKDR